MPVNSDPDLKSIIGVLLGVGVVVGGLVCLGGYLSKCQKCDKWFSKRTINKVLIKQEPGAKDVERTDKRYDKDGKYEGMIKRKERIYGKNITYDVTIQCGKCGTEHHQIQLQWKDA